VVRSVSLDHGERKVIYGKTRKDVATKLTGALQLRQHAIRFAAETLTVEQWLDQWLEHVVKNRPRANHL
jgi:hypothetical protein